MPRMFLVREIMMLVEVLNSRFESDLATGVHSGFDMMMVRMVMIMLMHGTITLVMVNFTKYAFRCAC